MLNITPPKIIIMNSDQYYLMGLCECLRIKFPNAHITIATNFRDLKNTMLTLSFDIVISGIHGSDRNDDNLFHFYRVNINNFIGKLLFFITQHNQVISSILSTGPICICKRDSLKSTLQRFSCPENYSKHYDRPHMLTLREIEILVFIYLSVPPAKIGKITGTSINTISNHKRSAMRKLKIRGNTMLLKYLILIM